MKLTWIKYVLLFSIIFSAVPLKASAQEEEEKKTPEELAYEQAEKMEKDLKLKPHQTFFVDSVLQHDMRALNDEFMFMRASGVQEVTVYQKIQEKWTSQIDSSFKKILNEDQWLLYLRNTGRLSKEQKKILRKKIKNKELNL